MTGSRILGADKVKSVAGHTKVGVRRETPSSRALPSHRKPHPKAPGTARPDHGAA